MSTYSVKLHAKTFIDKTDVEKSTVIRPYISPHERAKEGFIKSNDRLQMDVNIRLADISKPKDSDSMMEMEIPLYFSNKAEFLAAFYKAIKQFQKNEITDLHTKKRGYGLEIAFSRYNFSNDLPEYALEAITEILVKNKNYRHQFLKKLSVYTPEQAKKLETNLKCKEQFERFYKATDIYKHKSTGAFIITALGLFVSSYIVSAALFPYVFVLTAATFAANVSLSRVLDKLAHHFHENKDIIDTTTANYAAFTAGCSQPYSALFRHLRNPIAFLAAKRLTWLKQNHLVLVLEPTTSLTEAERKAHCEQRLAAILGKKADEKNNVQATQEQSADSTTVTMNKPAEQVTEKAMESAASNDDHAQTPEHDHSAPPKHKR